MSVSVSVVLPTLNERAFITDCLDSIVAQDYPGLLEVLVVDGGSVDGTAAIVERFGDPVRLVANPRVTAAAAMNIGVAEAKGEVIVRADAHSHYAPDYVRRCVEVLEDTGAANVGGRMDPIGTTRFGRAIAAVMMSRMGVGPGRYRMATSRETVDTVYLGCWRRETFERFGGFDEAGIQWAAEDHELNMRMRQGGETIVLDPAIRSWYYPRETPRRLIRQYANYGKGKASTLVKHRTLPSWRPLVPSALVLLAGVGATGGRRWTRVAVPLFHALGCGAAAGKIAARTDTRAVDVFMAMELCHWSYGVGFWAALGRAATGRGFQTRPGAKGR